MGRASTARPMAQGMARSPVSRAADSSVPRAPSLFPTVIWAVMAGMMLTVIGVMKAQGILKMVWVITWMPRMVSAAFWVTPEASSWPI